MISDKYSLRRRIYVTDMNNLNASLRDHEVTDTFTLPVVVASSAIESEPSTEKLDLTKLSLLSHYYSFEIRNGAMISYKLMGDSIFDYI